MNTNDTLQSYTYPNGISLTVPVERRTSFAALLVSKLAILVLQLSG